MFYHCEFCYQTDTGARTMLEGAESFRRNNGYNFVSEDQMMKTSAAVIHQTATAEGALLGDGLTVASLVKDTDYKLYDAEIAGSLGVRMVFAEYLDASEFSSDACMWERDGNAIVMSLDKAATVYKVSVEESRLWRVNMAAEIEAHETRAIIRFKGSGMMQVIVKGDAQTPDAGWKITRFDGKTMFTRYGENATLTVNYK